MYLIPIIGISVLMYGPYQLLLFLALNKEDNSQMRKGKIIIVRVVILLISLFLINSMLQWML